MSEQEVKHNEAAEGTYTSSADEQQTADTDMNAQDELHEPETAEQAEAQEDTADANSEETDAGSENSQLQAALEEQKDRYLRLQAEFDNFRRRSRQEKEETAKYASSKVMEQLLPIVDNFERAVNSSNSSDDYDALKKGLDMILRQLGQLMEQEGIKPIEAVGQPFNPELHQAVMQVESEDHEEGIVVEELQKGYMLKDKIIRPAMVKVSS
ncbi:nucleotide exchange factor GrpE [Marinicrinis sediminis]|uniref:Protein GrpE n=1 Tax=Marinicrinis sediminis TaxID=1652465 RepID=A0ABW5R9Y7_9BACL